MRQIASVIFRLLFLPVTLLLALLRLALRALGRIFAPALVYIDKSDTLSNVISTLSSSMSTQRGLLLMIGTALIVLSFLTHGIILTIMVATGSFDRHLYWLCIPFTMLHGGVLAGFIGIMLAVPLGQGYKSQQ